jgi:hypothetical protein
LSTVFDHDFEASFYLVLGGRFPICLPGGAATGLASKPLAGRALDRQPFETRGVSNRTLSIYLFLMIQRSTGMSMGLQIYSTISAYVVTQKVALKAAKSRFLVGLNAGKWAQKGGLKVALKRLLGGSKVHLNLQSLLQSPAVLQSRCLDSGPGLVQSRCWTPANSN